VPSSSPASHHTSMTATLPTATQTQIHNPSHALYHSITRSQPTGHTFHRLQLHSGFRYAESRTTPLASRIMLALPLNPHDAWAHGIAIRHKPRLLSCTSTICILHYAFTTSSRPHPRNEKNMLFYRRQSFFNTWYMLHGCSR
jgi:hypothetical protein